MRARRYHGASVELAPTGGRRALRASDEVVQPTLTVLSGWEGALTSGVSGFRESGEDVLGEPSDLVAHLLNRITDKQQGGELLEPGLLKGIDLLAHLIRGADQIHVQI